VFTAVTRGVALFLGVFTILNVVGDLAFARANTNVWWLDLWPVPILAARILMLGIALALMLYAVWPTFAARIGAVAQPLLFMAAAAAIFSAIRFMLPWPQE
jgi:hypothetical protein